MSIIDLLVLDLTICLAFGGVALARAWWLANQRAESRRRLLQRFAIGELDLAAYEREVAALTAIRPRERGLRALLAHRHG